MEMSKIITNAIEAMPTLLLLIDIVADNKMIKAMSLMQWDKACDTKLIQSIQVQEALPRNESELVIWNRIIALVQVEHRLSTKDQH